MTSTDTTETNNGKVKTPGWDEQFIRKCVGRGAAFTPLVGKAPILKGWQNRPPASGDEVMGWAQNGRNLGVRTGSVSNLAIIDIDAGAELGVDDFPPTITVRTGSGMIHLLYLIEKGNPPKSRNSKPWPHIDILSDGKQAVFVGSTHPKTKRKYEFVPGKGPGEIEMAVFPYAMVEGAMKPPPGDSGIEPSRENLNFTTRQFLNEPCPEGKRNCTLIAAAKDFKANNYPIEVAREELVVKRAVGRDGLDEGEAMRVLHNGYRGNPTPTSRNGGSSYFLPDWAAVCDNLLTHGKGHGMATKDTPVISMPDRDSWKPSEWLPGKWVSVDDDDPESSPAAVANTSGWPEPKPLPDELSPVDPFDCDWLPEAFAPWIGDISERIQCPPEFSAVAAMVALASVAGRRIGIRPKRFDDWFVTPNLWGGIVGDPSVMKSPALREPMKPLQRLEIESKGEYETKMLTHHAGMLVAKENKKVVADKIRKALKNGGDAEALAMQCLESDSDEPTRRRYIVNDATVEKLGELLNQNTNGLLVFRDELIGWMKSLDRDGHESSRAFHLEAWDGGGRFTYDRIGRGTVEISAACLSIIGSIQPGPLEDYIYAAVDGGAGADGLMQRFQLMVYPDIPETWTNVDRKPDTDARDAAYEVFERLDQLDAKSIGAEGMEGILYLHFDDLAQSRFNEWRSVLEHGLRKKNVHPVMIAHKAKFRSLIPTLALLIHLADDHRGRVGIVPLEKAIQWGAYLETHARRIYGGAINPSAATARLLLAKIEGGHIQDKFTLRDIYRNCWRGLDDRKRVEPAVGLLTSLGWLRESKKATGGRDKTEYRIHPKLLHIPRKGTDRTDISPDAPPSVSYGSASPEDTQKFIPESGGAE